MANQTLSSRRLALVAGLLALSFAGASAASDLGSVAKAAELTPDEFHGHEPRAYAYQKLDFPGSSQTIFWGLNDLGELAGQYEIAGGTAHAMTWRHGKFEALAPKELGTDFSAAGGPTDEGTTYGGYADAAGLQHGFQITRGHFRTIDFRGHLNSNIDGENSFGRILGVYWDADGAYHGIISHDGNEVPFDVNGAIDTYPLGINEAGDSVGYWDAGTAATHGYLRRANGEITSMDVPDAAATATFAINDRGQVAGYYADASGAIHGFVKTGQQVQQLDVPGALATIVTSLNNWSSVAGEYVDNQGARHGFIATLK